MLVVATPLFSSKAQASVAKLRGGYYTPDRVAAFLAGWVAANEGRVLEPSCGDGAILRHTERAEHVTGVELEPEEATKARNAAPWAEVVDADFFTWLDEQQFGAWDGVVGNPPFIRFQHWTEPTRSAALDLMRSVGLKPTKLTNAWVPFVVGSTLALKPGGRLGLVIPAELMQVSYSAQLRAFLIDECSELTVVTFRRLLFEGVLQEVVLLLGVRGIGPASIRVVEFDDADSLTSGDAVTVVPHAPALQHDSEKWTKYFLDPDEITEMRDVRASERLGRLGDLADVDVGVVTGRNRFFVMTPERAAERRLESFVSPVVGKSMHVPGIRFAAADLERLRGENATCQLLSLDRTFDVEAHEALRAYIAAGEAEGVHTGYKCSIRKQWWAVPSVWRPDAFLLRQIYTHPRLIANATAATSTDTVHRVRMLVDVDPMRLGAAMINSATFAFTEVIGRSYGGGVLELEPTEAENLLVPDPAGLTLEEAEHVDQLLRANDLGGALDFVDRTLLVDRLGLEIATVERLRRVWTKLAARRTSRGTKRPSTAP